MKKDDRKAWGNFDIIWKKKERTHAIIEQEQPLNLLMYLPGILILIL